MVPCVASVHSVLWLQCFILWKYQDLHEYFILSRHMGCSEFGAIECNPARSTLVHMADENDFRGSKTLQDFSLVKSYFRVLSLLFLRNLGSRGELRFHHHGILIRKCLLIPSVLIPIVQMRSYGSRGRSIYRSLPGREHIQQI